MRKTTEPVLLRQMRSWDDNDSTGFFSCIEITNTNTNTNKNDSRDEKMDLALDSLMCQNYKVKYKYNYENIRCSRNDGMDLALDSFIM